MVYTLSQLLVYGIAIRYSYSYTVPVTGTWYIVYEYGKHVVFHATTVPGTGTRWHLVTMPLPVSRK